MGFFSQQKLPICNSHSSFSDAKVAQLLLRDLAEIASAQDGTNFILSRQQPSGLVHARSRKHSPQGKPTELEHTTETSVLSYFRTLF
jgi:hypothetical protein